MNINCEPKEMVHEKIKKYRQPSWCLPVFSKAFSDLTVDVDQVDQVDIPGVGVNSSPVR